MPRHEINWTGLGFGLALSIFAAYQQLKLSPVLPILIGEYSFGRILAGGFMSIYAVVGLVLSLRLGNILQRRGTTTLLNTAFSLFAVASAIMMFWPQFGWLFLAARMMEGVAFAILAIAGPAICTANAGPRGLALAAALIATWIPMGALIANLLAAGLVDWAGWRALWMIGILATGAMALWTAVIRRNPEVRLGAIRTIPPTSRAPDAGAARAKRRSMILAALLFTVWSVQMFAYLTWLPDYLVNTHDFSPRLAALLFVVPMAVLTIFNLVAAPILRAGVPVAALFIASVSVQTAFWFLMPHLGPVAAAAGGLFIYAAAAGVAPTCLFAMPGTIFGIEHAGSYSYGVLMTGRNLGVLCGPLLTGALVHFTGGWESVPPTLGVMGLIAIAGALLLHARLRLAPAA
jgi:predicted MFS family arabinose efflux permease